MQNTLPKTCTIKTLNLHQPKMSQVMLNPLHWLTLRSSFGVSL